MNDTTKRNEPEHRSEEEDSGFSTPDKYRDQKLATVFESPRGDKDVDLEGNGSKDAGLSERFFISDLSED